MFNLITETMKTEKTKKLMKEAVNVIVEVMGKNAKIGQCYTDTTTCYILGNHIFKTPLEIHVDDTKTMFNVLFFDTMKMENWSMTLRKPSKGYFIHEGDFYTECEDNADMAVQVSKKQVLDEIRSACESFKVFSDIEKALDKGESVFAAMRKK